MIISLGSSEKQEDEAAGTSIPSEASNSSLNGDVATLEESSQASGSTGSWDMPELVEAAATLSSTATVATDTTVATTSVQTEDLGEQMKAAQIALLKSQVETLRAENLEKSKLVEQQNERIQDLTEKLLEKDELVDENAMKTTLLESQEEKIKELVKEVDEKDAVKAEQVTDKFYEAEEEIAGLRTENAKAAAVINAVLLATRVLRKEEDSPLDYICSCSKAVDTFNVLWDGVDSADAPKLKALATDFAEFVVDQDDECAVAFWADADNHTHMDDPQENVFIRTTLLKCWDLIRTKPTLLLNSYLLNKWSAEKMEHDLVLLETDELTKFRVLSRWYSFKREAREAASRLISKSIRLEHIDPLQLTTFVRPSGLVSDAQLCDAFGKQAVTKALDNERTDTDSSRNASPSNKPVAPSTSDDFKHTWDTTNSAILSSADQWKTGSIPTKPLKATGDYMWKVRVEEPGEILCGLSSSSFNHEKDDISKFGKFLKCCECEKGEIISFWLRPSQIGPGMTFQACTLKWMKHTVVEPAMAIDDLLVTVSVQNGASVNFSGFGKCTDVFESVKF
ncbi:MAG: hypothetical protein SGILL_003094 [Bacillariaceae sp.]